MFENCIKFFLFIISINSSIGQSREALEKKCNCDGWVAYLKNFDTFTEKVLEVETEVKSTTEKIDEALNEINTTQKELYKLKRLLKLSFTNILSEEFNGKILFYPKSKNENTGDYTFSKTVCEKYGGKHVKINSKDDNEFAYSFIATIPERHNIGYFIDGTLRDNNNVVTFEDGSKSEYTNWSPGEPKDPNEAQCTSLAQIGREREWDNIQCKAVVGVLCEMNLYNGPSGPPGINRTNGTQGTQAVKCNYEKASTDRKECGYGGISKTECENRGCCFDDSIVGVIWCFKGDNGL